MHSASIHRQVFQRRIERVRVCSTVLGLLGAAAFACTPRAEHKEPASTTVVTSSAAKQLADAAHAKKPQQNRLALPPLAHVDVSRRGQTIEGLGMFGPEKVWWGDEPYFDESYLDFVVSTLGASMFRTQVYWDGEPKNDDSDPQTTNLAAFDFSPKTLNGRQFPWLKALGKHAGVKVIASVWTPPAWMKLDADDKLAVFCHGQCGGRLNPDLREEFAEYLVTYVKVVKAQTGVDLYALSIANEPIFANPFESCVYTAEEYAKTLDVIVARFRREGLATRFFGPEHMGNAGWNRSLGFQPLLLENKSRARALHAFAVHGYLDGVNPDTGTAQGWMSFQKETEQAGVALWMTETSGKDDAEYSAALKQAQGMHYALKDGQVSAWVFWYLGPPHIKRESSGFSVTPLVNLLRHYYALIRPGDVQIAVESDGPDVLSLAFMSTDAEPPRVSVISLNRTSEPRSAPPVTHDHPGWRVVRVAQTTEKLGYQEKSKAGADGVPLPGNSISSWLLQPVSE